MDSIRLDTGTAAAAAAAAAAMPPSLRGSEGRGTQARHDGSSNARKRTSFESMRG